MWNRKLKTRLSNIVLHLHVGNNYRQILTQHNCKKGFLQCHFKMFSKPLSPLEVLKTNKSVFYSEPGVLPCFELNYKLKNLKTMPVNNEDAHL